MINRRGFSFESVVKPATASEIRKLSPYAIELARRWVREWPESARQLEAAGKLIPALKVHAEKESLQQWRSQIRNLPPLARLGDTAARREGDFGQP